MSHFFQWLTNLSFRLLRLIFPKPARSNTPPSVHILPFAGTVLNSPFLVHYSLIDAESDPVHIQVAFSTDNGGTFLAASESSNAGSDGTSGLTSSPMGVVHVFGWDAKADLTASHTAGVLIRIQAFDSQPGGIDTSMPVNVDTVSPSTSVNTPPSVQLLPFASGALGSPVLIRYSLRDAESDLIHIEVSFSTDGGTTFHAASEAVGVGSDGVNGLSSNPTGVIHQFAWDAKADLPFPQATGVITEIRPFDVQAGASDSSAPFDVDTTVVHLSAPLPPNIHVFDPVSDIGAQVPLRFIVEDPDNQMLDVIAEYSYNGSGYQVATPAPTSDRLQGLPAPFIGADYRFIWDAAVDLQGTGTTVGSAKLRLTPLKSGVAGPTMETGAFRVNLAPGFNPPAMFTPKVPVDAKIEITDGDNQTGVSGHFLAKRTEVRVHDGQNRPLPNVFVGFTAFLNGKQYGGTAITSTDNDGKASSWVEGKKEAGPGTVEARIIGAPSQVAKFHYSLQTSRVLPFQFSITSALTGAFGTQYSFAVYCEHYEDLPLGPVELVMKATSAKGPASDPVIVTSTGAFETIGFSPWRKWNFTFIPMTPNDTISIEIKSSIDSTVMPLQFAVTVEDLRGQRRTGLANYSPYPLTFRPAAGSPTASTALVGIPEMTMQTQFEVKLLDPSGAPLSLCVTQYSTGCVPPTTSRIFVTWTVLNGGGTLSDSPTPGVDSVISVDIDKGVYFTPGAMTGSDAGQPWMITASIGPFVGGILDSNPLQFTNSSGGCERDNVFSSFSTATYAFVVRRATVQFTSGVGAKKKVVTNVKAGDRVRLEVSGLTPTTPTSQPPKADLMAIGGDLGSFTGGSLAISQSLTLAKVAPDALVSDEILVTQGDPSIQSLSPIIVGVAPGGLLNARIDDMSINSEMASRSFERKHSGPYLGSMQESPVGTSPSSGAANTVMLRNGEFVYDTIDLDYAARAQTIAVSRTYRSQAKNDGPFGPGWFFNHGQFLTVADDLTLRRWISSRGRYAELWTNRPPMKGMFLKYVINYTLDSDSGPYKIIDPHRNELHFNLDGSLRLAKDRLGNFLRYRYDEKAQLIELLDPHQRALSFEYWTEADPVEPETVGRIKRITDFAGRSIDYEYYGKGDPSGAPGYLKKVTFPPAATLLPGATTPDDTFRRSETYIYNVNPQDRLDGQLVTILDSQGATRLTNRYDSDSRVREQDFGTGTFKFDYDVTLLNTVATDRKGNTTTWNFPESPLPDGATPTMSVESAGPEDVVNTFQFNYDGNLIHHKLGSRGAGGSTVSVAEEMFFVYDDAAAEERQHGNLLAVRQKSLSGAERVSSYEYTTSVYAPNDYNFVRRVVGPRGNVPGVNSEIYATRYLYDHEVTPALAAGDPDLVPDNKGNLVRILLPRALHMVVGQGASGNHEGFWIDGNAEHKFKYNSFGLLMWHKDPHGVVTENSYYPDKTPCAGVPSSAEGGFLAMSQRDTAGNPMRDMYLQGLALSLQTTRRTYDALGHVSQITDNGGNTTTMEWSDLHEMKKVTYPANANGSTQPSVIETSIAYSILGVPVRRMLSQPGASDDSGGEHPYQELATDGVGNVRDVFSTVKKDSTVIAHISRDQNDELTELYSDDSLPHSTTPALYGSSGFGVVLDPRGLPTSLKEGIAQGTGTGVALLSSQYEWAANGSIKKYTRAGSQNPFDYHQDPYGDVFGIVDPRGNAVRILTDDGGLGSRRVVQHGEGGPNEVGRAIEPSVVDAPVLGFSETRIDELGRARRTHSGSFTPNQPGPGGGIPTMPSRVPEYFPQAPFPPEVGKLLRDGRWGPGDGRITADRMLDALDLPTRIVDDELGFVFVRRDAHGRPCEASIWGGDDPSKPQVIRLLKYSYDDSGNVETAQVTDRATDQTITTKVFPQKLVYDAAGRVVRTIDGEGNAHGVEYDQMGYTYVSYDAMGPDSTEPPFNGHTMNQNGNKTTYMRDGLGRTTKVETTLTVGGIGGAPQDTSNPYNPHGTVNFELRYSGDGRLLSYMDHATNETIWSYDTYGRFHSVNYPNAPALGGATSVVVEYDPKTGLVNKTIDGNLVSIEYSHDELRRLAKMELKTPGIAGSRGYAFEYAGNQIVVTELDQSSGLATGREVELTHDSLGRLQREKQGGVVVESEYDGNGRRTRIGYPNNHGDVHYIYDSAGRLRRILDRGTEVARFEYSGLERLTSRAQSGVTSSFSYSDGSGRFMSMNIQGLKNPGPYRFDLERDRMNRLTHRTCTRGTTTEDKRWRFDSAGRVISEVFRPAPNRAPGQIVTTRLFDGDTVLCEETRESVVAPGIVEKRTAVRGREERGRVVQVDEVVQKPVGQVISQASKHFKYDHNGNLVDDGVQQYSYDAFNRLFEVRNGNQTIASFAYDPMNRLISRTSSSMKEEYVYADGHLIEVTITPAGGSASTERYVYSDQVDDIVSVEKAGVRHLLLYTPEGYVEALTDAQQNIVERYDYDLNGGVTVLDPSGTPINSAPQSRFLFQRHPYDAETGLFNYRMRWYNPRIASFLTPDPRGFAEGANQYGLNHGDPVNFVDSFGMDDEPTRVPAIKNEPRTGAAAAASTLETLLERSIWSRGWSPRGFIFDQLGGNNLGLNTKNADYRRGDFVGQIKSVDTSNPRSIKGAVRKAARDASSYIEGTGLTGVRPEPRIIMPTGASRESLAAAREALGGLNPIDARLNLTTGLPGQVGRGARGLGVAGLGLGLFGLVKDVRQGNVASGSVNAASVGTSALHIAGDLLKSARLVRYGNRLGKFAGPAGAALSAYSLVQDVRHGDVASGVGNTLNLASASLTTAAMYAPAIPVTVEVGGTTLTVLSAPALMTGSLLVGSAAVGYGIGTEINEHLSEEHKTLIGETMLEFVDHGWADIKEYYFGTKPQKDR